MNKPYRQKVKSVWRAISRAVNPLSNEDTTTKRETREGSVSIGKKASVKQYFGKGKQKDGIEKRLENRK